MPEAIGDNLACLYSLAGEVSSALDALEKPYEAGLADPDWMRQDSDLDNIRNHPRYRALVEQMEAASWGSPLSLSGL